MTFPRLWSLSGLVLLAACAPTRFRADVGAAFTRVQGELGLQNSAGSLVLNSNMNDIDEALGVGDSESSPYVRLEADINRHRIKASGFGHNSTGTGTLTGDFGDLLAGTQVATDFDFAEVSGSWSYDLLPDDKWRLGVGVQVGYYALDFTVRSLAGSAFEQVDTELVAPMPYVDAEVQLGKVSIGANAGAMSASIGDGNGRYWDAEAFVRAQPVAHVDLIAGVRYLLFDAHGEATGRDFDADIDVLGWFIGAGVRF